MKGEINLNLKVNKKSALAIIAALGVYAYADFVSLVDTKSSGGITVTGGVTDSELEASVSDLQAQIDELKANELPVGTIAMWTNTSIPNGWLKLDGGSTSGYPELAAIVGSNVPDYSGKFVRALGGASAGLGETQAQSVQSLGFSGDAVSGHKHSRGTMDITGHFGGGFYMERAAVGTTGAFHKRSNVNTKFTGEAWTDNGQDFFFTASRSWTGETSLEGAHTPSGTITGTGSETRPENITAIYIIKAK